MKTAPCETKSTDSLIVIQIRHLHIMSLFLKCRYKWNCLRDPHFIDACLGGNAQYENPLRNVEF